MLSESPSWIVRVEGHADGVAYVGPFVDKGEALRFSLATIDTLPEFDGFTTAYPIPLHSVS